MPRAGVAPAPLVLADRRGIGDVHNRDRVSWILDVQAQPQADIGQQVLLDHPVGALRGQYQVHADRAAAGGDVDQAGEELRHLLGQVAELVDNEDEPGQRAKRLASGDVVPDAVAAGLV